MNSALIWLLLTISLLSGCANYQQRASLLKPQPHIIVGSTNQQAIIKLLGQPAEQHLDQGRAIWVYTDKLEVPLAVSLIPIVGDVADAVEMAHTNRELIIQFDEQAIVRKYKLREIK